MHACIYLRVSTDEQLKHGISLAVQADACRVAAIRAGATEVVLFEDGGYSGTTLKRPALTDLRSRLGEFSTVYVYKLDRLCRSVKSFADLMQEFSDAGVGFVSVTEGISYTGAASRLTMHMLSAAAAFFADLNKERVRDALAYRVEVEGKPHGPAPYGLRRNDAGTYVPHEDEAPWVRDLFLRYARGASLGDLAQWLTAQGVPPRRHAARWQETQVRGILSNPTYTGALHWHGATQPGKHEALVSSRVWRQAQARLAANATIPSQSRRSSLAPLLTCGYCRGRVVRAGSHGGTYPGYKCGVRRYALPEDRHPPLHVSAPVLEEGLWRYTGQYLGEDLAAGLQEAQEERARRAVESHAPELRARLREVEERQARLLRGYSLGQMGEDVLGAEAAPLAAEHARLLAALAELQPPPNLADLRRLASLADPARALRRARSKPADMQVAFLRELFPCVEVLPRRIIVHHALEQAPVTLDLPRRLWAGAVFLCDEGPLE